MKQHFCFTILQKKCFENFTSADLLLSPATAGMITSNENDECFTLVYDTVLPKRSCFFVALMEDSEPSFQLRIIVTEYGVSVIKINPSDFIFQTISRFYLNTTCIIGIKPKTQEFQLLIKAGKTIFPVKWNHLVGFECTERRLFDASRQIHENTDAVCHNCGKNHTISKCMYPYYTVHCTGCLVVSLNGSHHINPCQPINKVSIIRSSILAENVTKLFNMSYESHDMNLYYLQDGTFHEISSATKLISSAAESCLIFNAEQNKWQMSLLQSSFKRCSILIAVRDANFWRLRFRLVITPNDGLLVFRLHSTINFNDGKLDIPPNHQSNAVAVLGISALKPSFYLQFVTYASNNESESTCYEGWIGVDRSGPQMETSIGHELMPSNRSKRMRFNSDIYKPEPQALSSFRQQRMSQANASL